MTVGLDIVGTASKVEVLKGFSWKKTGFAQVAAYPAPLPLGKFKIRESCEQPGRGPPLGIRPFGERSHICLIAAAEVRGT